jgi:phosphatidylinositol alpha 1,6-mannosyltransferase
LDQVRDQDRIRLAPEVVARLRSAARGSERIHFLGFVHGQDRATIFASVDAFCTASPDETFGRTVVEAMASGVPVVAPASGGFTDYLRHDENALLFPNGDDDALVHALDRALTSDVAALTARAFDAAQGFSIEAGCSRLLDWYRQSVQATVGPRPA